LEALRGCQFSIQICRQFVPLIMCINSSF